MKRVSSMTGRNYDDLVQKVHIAEWRSELPHPGSIKIKTIKTQRRSRQYYYWQSGQKQQYGSRDFYLGPADDPEIQKRVDEFKREKALMRERRDLVRMLTSMGLPQPSRRDAEVVQAIAQAGFFRLRGVLIGSLAYQTYSGMLGVQLPESTMQTEDVDLAQFHSIAITIDDETFDLKAALSAADPTFREQPHHSDPRTITKLVAEDGYAVEFLTPNYSADDYQDKPPLMPALGNMAAQPLRHLDFLIHRPTSAVLLHRGGIAVNVPRPERYAVHKLLVAPQRIKNESGQGKARKDMEQAGHLIEAMQQWHRFELGEAWMEAWDRGPSWRQKLEVGKGQLSEERRDQLEGAVREACSDYGVDPDQYLDATRYNPNQDAGDEYDEDEEETADPGMEP